MMFTVHSTAYQIAPTELFTVLEFEIYKQFSPLGFFHHFHRLLFTRHFFANCLFALCQLVIFPLSTPLAVRNDVHCSLHCLSDRTY
jgi:hypothetical protein